ALRSDGSTYPVEVHPRTIPVELSSGTMRVVAMRDMSARRQLEDQLRQAQKLEAIGRLAGGIAHDFNNLLSVVLGAAELAATELPEGHPSREELTAITDAAERAAELTRQLLAFGRKAVLRPEVVDAARIIRDMQSILRRLLSEPIGLHLHLPAEPAWLRVDPIQLEQVVLNLVLNARDAMPQGGRLDIHVELVELDAGRTVELDTGPCVRIAVTDTGIGMDSETRTRVFEPFFTTKEAHQGSGLGLATVFGLVKQSGGAITIDSEPGCGSTFVIWLPACPAPARVEPADEAAAPEPALAREPFATEGELGNRTVLVVEDEAALRRVIVEVLGRAGYRVLSAADPHLALELVVHHGEYIDLLLTDVLMPHMSGVQLAELVTNEHEQIRVLFMSGYTDTELSARGGLDPGISFVAKPIDSSKLLDAVSGALSPDR
ncbi:MAG: response regulator, partial [Myxococcales bacterium]|nr:response regulator [Myxococcales bacterium]